MIMILLMIVLFCFFWIGESVELCQFASQALFVIGIAFVELIGERESHLFQVIIFYMIIVRSGIATEQILEQ